MEAGEPTTAWGRRSCPCVISLGHPCQCSGMAGSAPAVWILMVFRFWEISTPTVFRKCGMDRCCPGLETTLESSTTVSIQSVSPAIGYAGVRMAPAQSYQFAFKIEVIEKSGEVTASSQKDRTPNYKRRTPVCMLNANPIVMRVPRTPQDLAARVCARGQELGAGGGCPALAGRPLQRHS